MRYFFRFVMSLFSAPADSSDEQEKLVGWMIIAFIIGMMYGIVLCLLAAHY